MGRLSNMAPEKSVLNLPSVSSNCPEESYSSCQWYHAGRRGHSEQRISSVPLTPLQASCFKANKQGSRWPHAIWMCSLQPLRVSPLLHYDNVRNEVSEVSQSQKLVKSVAYRKKTWRCDMLELSSHARTTSFSNNKASENNNKVTKSVSAVARVTQDGN